MGSSFSVINGQIFDPNGYLFVARGINVFLGQANASTILGTFPGINAVRLATSPGADPNAIDALVQGLTTKGVAVLIEDHTSSGGNPNTLSGQALTNEANWYAGLASKYQANPYVWFGTANEPDNTANLSAIPAQERAIYDAIRGTGSNAMVMMEMRGGFTNDAAQASASTYASMRNVAWDTHYYGWVSGFSTDTGAIANALSNQIANAQSVRSADAIMPVVIGEYGPSTTGIAGYDANGLQVVQAVDSSGYGTFAWAFHAGTDALVSSGTSLTDFGQLVARHIADGAALAPRLGTPSVTPAVAPSVTPTAGTGPDTLTLNLSEDAYLGNAQARITIDGRVLADAQSVTALHSLGQTGAFVFQGDFGAGAHTVGVTFLNDAWGGSASTDRNLYLDGITYDGTPAASATHAFYSNGASTFAVGGTTPPPTPAPTPMPASAANQLDLAIAEDAWNGDAQYTVSVDGAQVGGTLTAHASHAAGAVEHVLLNGSWGAGTHAVTIAFINDAWGGSASTDRNLYLDGITYDGTPAASATHAFYSNGASTFAVGGTTPPPPTGDLTVHLSEDAWMGDAQFQLTLDGKALGTGGTVTALHSAGKLQDFAFSGIAAGPHQLGVTFTNDAWGGTDATDRNLYVGSIDYAGHSTPGATLLSNGTHIFAIG